MHRPVDGVTDIEVTSCATIPSIGPRGQVCPLVTIIRQASASNARRLINVVSSSSVVMPGRRVNGRVPCRAVGRVPVERVDHPSEIRLRDPSSICKVFSPEAAPARSAVRDHEVLPILVVATSPLAAFEVTNERYRTGTDYSSSLAAVASLGFVGIVVAGRRFAVARHSAALLSCPALGSARSHCS